MPEDIALQMPRSSHRPMPLSESDAAPWSGHLRPGVFAAGDVVHGSKTVVHAVQGAKMAAEGMIRYMESRA